MAADVFSFHWPVFRSGYQWARGRVHEKQDFSLVSEEQWVLIEGAFQGPPGWRQYSPLKDFPALFRDFARLETGDMESVLAFANSYGKLGLISFVDFGPLEEPSRIVGTMGETYQAWVQQIEQMRDALAIWDMIQARDNSTLSHYIRWQPSGACWVYDTHHGVEPLQTPPIERRRRQFIESALDLLKPDDVFMPAMFLVQRWVNDHLDGHIAARLLYDLALSTQVLNIVPHDLTGAMWLQFAQAIAGHKQYVACKECGRWIEISHRQADRRTKRREFCSDACKSKNYRQKKDRAAKEAAAKAAAPKKRRSSK